MSRETKNFETAAALLEFLTELATRQSSSRYQIRAHTNRPACAATADAPCTSWREGYENYRGEMQEAFCYGHPVLTYYLQRDGRSGWHGAPRHEIPSEIGEKFAEGWKKNQYNDFLGYRGVKRLLKDLGADAGLNAKIKEAKLAVEKQGRRNQIERQIKILDEMIVKRDWLSADIRTAIAQQADVLVTELNNL